MFDQLSWDMQSVLYVIGNALILLGVISIYIGLLGMFRFRDFMLRVLSASKVDTVGLALVLLGVALRSGVSWFAAKSLLILLVVLVATPIMTAQLTARQRDDQLAQEAEAEALMAESADNPQTELGSLIFAAAQSKDQVRETELSIEGAEIISGLAEERVT